MDSVIRWVHGQGTRELDEALMRISGEAETRRARPTPSPPTTR